MAATDTALAIALVHARKVCARESCSYMHVPQRQC